MRYRHLHLWLRLLQAHGWLHHLKNGWNRDRHRHHGSKMWWRRLLWRHGWLLWLKVCLLGLRLLGRLWIRLSLWLIQLRLSRLLLLLLLRLLRGR